VRPTAPPPGRTFRFDQREAFSAAFLSSIALFPTSHHSIAHASQDSRHFDQTALQSAGRRCNILWPRCSATLNQHQDAAIGPTHGKRQDRISYRFADWDQCS